MIIYVTKWALTKGILKREGIPTRVGGGFSYEPEPGSFVDYVYGKSFQLTEADAIARANEMRLDKLDYLARQMNRLADMTFDIIE